MLSVTDDNDDDYNDDDDDNYVDDDCYDNDNDDGDDYYDDDNTRDDDCYYDNNDDDNDNDNEDDDGDDNGLLQSIPACLAVPLYAVSKELGLPTGMCHANRCLANWALVDPKGSVAGSGCMCVYIYI